MSAFSRAVVFVAFCAALASGAPALSDLVSDDHEPPPASHLARSDRPPVGAPPPTRSQSHDVGARAEPAAGEADRAQLQFKRPRAYAKGTPERALAAFMSAWRDRHWSRRRPGLTLRGCASLPAPPAGWLTASDAGDPTAI